VLVINLFQMHTLSYNLHFEKIYDTFLALYCIGEESEKVCSNCARNIQEFYGYNNDQVINYELSIGQIQGVKVKDV